MGEEKDYHPRHIMSMFSHIQIFATPWTEAHQASLSFTISWRLIKFMSIDLVMLSNYFILCHPLLLLPSIFPNIRISFNELALHIKRPKYWSFSFSISPCISTTIPKHQFFSTQPSLWFNSHIHTWLLENPYLWLYGLFSTKWCLCFLIHCLDLS